MRCWIFAMCVVVYPVPVGANPELEVGLKGGLSAATQAADYRAHAYGFAGGLASWLQWETSPRFSLAGQLELLYMPRGADVVYAGELQGWYELPYFDVALAVRPAVRFGPTSVYLLLGGSLNLLLKADMETATGWREDISKHLRQEDVALLVGAGATWRFSRRTGSVIRPAAILLEVRRDHGLLDTNVGDVAEWRNRTTSVMFGVSFTVFDPG